MDEMDRRGLLKLGAMVAGSLGVAGGLGALLRSSGPIGPRGSVPPYSMSGRPWIDVIAYGADPTGASDGTAAINNAISAAAAAGGAVFFAGGTYRISGQITVPSGVIMVQGNGASIRLADNVNPTVYGIFQIEAANCTLENFTLDCNKAQQAVAPDHYAEGLTIGRPEWVAPLGGEVSGVQLRNVRVLNTTGSGIATWGAHDIRIEGCSIENAGTTGRSQDGYGISVAYASNISIVGCRITSPLFCGINCYGFTEGVITGNVLTRCGTFGMVLSTGPEGPPTSNVAVTGNYVECTDPNWNCIDIGQTTNLTVSGNVCVGGSGVANDGPSFKCSIVGNTCLNGNVGIYFGGRDHGQKVGGEIMDSVITGNVIDKARLWGIVTNYMIDCIISDNMVKNSSQDYPGSYPGILLQGVEGVLVTGNRSGDDQATKTQAYGIELSVAPEMTSSNTLIVGNHFLGNLSGAVDNQLPAGQQVTFRNNLGVADSG